MICPIVNKYVKVKFVNVTFNIYLWIYKSPENAMQKDISSVTHVYIMQIC